MEKQQVIFYLESGSQKWLFNSKEERDHFIKENNIKYWITAEYDKNGKRILDSGTACFSGLL